MQFWCCFHRRLTARICSACGLPLCEQCCSYYGRCMGCHHQTWLKPAEPKRSA